MEHSSSSQRRQQQDKLTETTYNEVDAWEVGTDLISKVSFRTYDLLEEGARMFLLIEGDALVADLINNPLLDFKHGGQFLHLTFLLERFIKEKALRGAQLVFIFFQCFEQTLYSKRNASHDWQRLLVRRLVLTHLNEELQMPVKIFKNWWSDPHWAEYLRRVRPPLMAICTEIDSHVKSIRRSKTALRLLCGFFLHCLDAGMRCVSLSSMNVHGPALNAFVAALDTFTSRKKVKGLMPSIYESIRLQQYENHESRSCPLCATTMRSLGGQLLAVFQPFMPAHEALAMAYMSLALMIAPPLTKMSSPDEKASHEDGIIRRVLLLSLIIKHSLSLKARAQPLTNMPRRGGKSAATSTTSLIERGLFLLDQVYERMLGLLPQPPDDLRMDWWPPSCHLRLHDLFDGRLFCVLLERLCERASHKNRKTCTQPQLSTLLGLSSRVLDVVSPCWKILFPTEEWNIVLGKDVLVWLELKTSEGASHSVSTVLIPAPQNQEKTHPQLQNELCQRCLTASKAGVQETFNESSQENVPDSWEDIEDDQATEMKKQEQSSEESSDEFMLLHTQQPLFPIHHRLADAVMGQELIQQWAHYDEQSSSVREVLAHRERFLEIYHWHSLRKLDDTRKRPGYFQQLKLIDNQSSLHRYSESLKLNRSLRTITVEDTNKKNKKLKRDKQLAPAALAMKEAQMKKSRIKIVRQLDGQYEEILEWVRNAQNDGNYELCLKKLDEFLQSAKESVEHCKKAKLHKLLICQELFVLLERSKQVAVDIFTLVHNIYSSFNALLSTSDCQCLIEALQASELCASAIDLAEQMVNDKKITEDHFAQLNEAIPTNGCKRSDSILFQLQHAGEAMEWEKQPHNPHDSARYGFMPDEWQREMIRVVDENKSMLVCAPTSSGKTFIGFYAIETVLRRSDTGVVVFVCPTKALVNQVYAEIYATFRKTFKEKNQALLGLFTADMKINPTKCSVLVTVPQCLQILLLSPFLKVGGAGVCFGSTLLAP